MARRANIVIVLFSALVLWTTPAVRGAEKINFSFSSLVGTQSPLWAAKEAGFFKKHGLDANLIYIPGGSVVVQTLLSGEVLMGVSGPGAVIRANLGGADFVYVGANSNRIDFVILAHKNIKSVQDLRGKRIGIGRYGGGPDYTGRIVFEKLGMRVDKDVIFTQTLGGQPTRLAMLQSGAIDGVVISPPATLQAKQMGFNAVLDYATIIPNYFSSGYFTTRKLIRDNPRLVETIVKALLDGTRYVTSNEDGTVKLLSRYLQITDEAFLRTYYREVLIGQINRNLYPDPKGIDFVLDSERKTNPAAANVKPEDFVDTRILDKLRKEGY